MRSTHGAFQQGYDPSAPINANESFHRVLSCELGSSRGAFRILYTAQTDAIDRKGAKSFRKLRYGTQVEFNFRLHYSPL